MEKVTYAGVNVVEVPEVVSKHLPIPRGMGLVVTEIVKGSPAERAGIRKDDILLKFDDQLLASQDQLRKLTRSRRSGDKVALTLMQEGKEKAVELVLGEREEDVANPGHGPWQPFGWTKDGPHPMAENIREAAERARDLAARKFEEAKRQIQERREKAGESGRPGGEVVERMEREIRHLREEVERLRGQGGRGEGEGVRRERPPGPPRDGERPPGGRRDGERAPGGPRDGERAPEGQREGKAREGDRG
jgi:membrane-associated protease RseP (regulator of RpoE activity)